MVTANQLSIEMHLLHHIIMRIFIPKTRRFNFITKRELLLMYHLVWGIFLNLPSMMMHQMRQTMMKMKAWLPYTMALTLVFKEFKVPLEREISKTLLHSNMYNDQSLH